MIPWQCNKCGSQDVEQEWTFYASLNDLDSVGDASEHAIAVDNFWCIICDDTTAPVRKQEARA